MCMISVDKLILKFKLWITLGNKLNKAFINLKSSYEFVLDKVYIT